MIGTMNGGRLLKVLKALGVAALMAPFGALGQPLVINVGETFGVFYGVTSGNPSPQLLHDFQMNVSWTNSQLAAFQTAQGGNVPQFSQPPTINPVAPTNMVNVASTNSETPCPVSGPDIAFNAPPVAPQENEFVLVFTANAPGTMVFTGSIVSMNLCEGGNLVPATNISNPPPLEIVIVQPTAAQIPTMSEWGMIILSTLLAGVALWAIRRRRTMG
jgi:hypothetical protein